MLTRADNPEMLGLALCTLIYHQPSNRFSAVCRDVTWYQLGIIWRSQETTETPRDARGVSSGCILILENNSNN